MPGDNPYAVWERNFLEQMVRLREARQMTQTDLARELKFYGLPFHQQTIQRIESGERPVRLNEAHLIAKVLNAELEAMTATGTPPDREMRYSVGRLRRASENAAEGLSGDLNEWLDDVESFAYALSERLKADTNNAADPVAIWGLAWGVKIVLAYHNFADTWNSLSVIHGKPTKIEPEDEWEMTLPSTDVIDALSSLCEQYMNSEVRILSTLRPRELWACFPGDHDGDSDSDEANGAAQPKRPGYIVNDEEFLASIRNGSRAPGGPRATIDDLQGLTQKERKRLTEILAMRYADGDSFHSLASESNLLPVTIYDLFVEGAIDIREDDLKGWRKFRNEDEAD